MTHHDAPSGQPFIWDGQMIGTAGELGAAAIKAMDDGEAAHFLDEYRAVEPEHADANLGYLFGYYDEDTRRRLYETYRTAHPIFGKAV